MFEPGVVAQAFTGLLTTLLPQHKGHAFLSEAHQKVLHDVRIIISVKQRFYPHDN